jgi:hypothetical protein
MINAKTAKEIRRAIPHWRMAVHEQLAVKSWRYASVTIRSADGTETFHENTALQVRLQAGCPKQLYKRMKKYVESRV